MSQINEHNLEPGTGTPDSGVASPARRQLLAMGTALLGVAVAGSIFGSAPAQADNIIAKVGKVLYLDGIVLNFAYEMEEMQSNFFGRISSTKAYAQLSTQEQYLLNLFAVQDLAHFNALNNLREELNYKEGGRSEYLNQEATHRPRVFTFPRLHSRERLLEVSLDIKESVLFAYHGAVGLLHQKAILAPAAAIAGVEGRHVAVLRAMMEKDPVAAPFEGALTAQCAGNHLSHYGFNGGAMQ